jgi:hypothetical protein
MYNMIITSTHTDCKYCHEKECGKDAIYLDDAECLAIQKQKGEEDVQND